MARVFFFFFFGGGGVVVPGISLTRLFIYSDEREYYFFFGIWGLQLSYFLEAFNK